MHHQQWEDYGIRRAIQPSNMADAQKSYFIAPQKGYIRDEDIMAYEIPSELKEGILRHLRNVYGIEPSTVYNDISGFIRDQDSLPVLEADYYAGMKADAAGNWDEAICFYTKCLDNPDSLIRGIERYLFYKRGIANYHSEKLDDAFRDFEDCDLSGGDWEEEVPEKIKNWFDVRVDAKEEERERQEESQRARNAETAAGIKDLWIEARDPKGNPVDGARFKLLSEDGFEDSGEIKAGRVQALIPAECCGSKCWFWFNKKGYCGFNPLHAKLGDSFTIALKPNKCNADPKEVTIKVTYEIEERA